MEVGQTVVEFQQQLISRRSDNRSRRSLVVFLVGSVSHRIKRKVELTSSLLCGRPTVEDIRSW